jgi:hypothetical protein
MRNLHDVVDPLKNLVAKIVKYEAARGTAGERAAELRVERAALPLAVFIDSAEWDDEADERPPEHEALAQEIRLAAFGVLAIGQPKIPVYCDGQFVTVAWKDVREERFRAVRDVAKKLDEAVAAADVAPRSQLAADRAKRDARGYQLWAEGHTWDAIRTTLQREGYELGEDTMRKAVETYAAWKGLPYKPRRPGRPKKH